MNNMSIYELYNLKKSSFHTRPQSGLRGVLGENMGSAHRLFEHNIIDVANEFHNLAWGDKLLRRLENHLKDSSGDILPPMAKIEGVTQLSIDIAECEILAEEFSKLMESFRVHQNYRYFFLADLVAQLYINFHKVLPRRIGCIEIVTGTYNHYNTDFITEVTARAWGHLEAHHDEHFKLSFQPFKEEDKFIKNLTHRLLNSNLRPALQISYFWGQSESFVTYFCNYVAKIANSPVTRRMRLVETTAYVRGIYAPSD